ncbi:hypothetical protein [Sciscionella marina]|uniref:hypothetical protein n=1 Tax=Sciscionella marina TaxID=508770 RepID=UPI0003715726|nr:hypothetical protein [Sciscionella marina]
MSAENSDRETYNPWSVVHLVFDHLADRGLHPAFGESGDPSAPAAELLRALGIHPSVKPDTRIQEGVREELAALRKTMFDES